MWAFRPFEPQAVLETTAEVAAIYDLKRLAQVVIRTSTSSQAGEHARTEWSIIVRGEGNFGGPPLPKREEAKPPADRPCDARIQQATRRDQALLYRLSGDLNPLHADPELARKVGFERGPILHGLCTFGFAGRAIIESICGRDSTRLRSIHGQFRKPVWPGDTLVTEAWSMPNRVVFQVKVAERNEVVMSNAWAQVD